MNKYFITSSCLLIAAMLLTFPTLGGHPQPANVPIAFYGKAVDQNGDPVTGAKVNFVIGILRVGEADADEEPVTLTTDDEGRFSLTGTDGYAIDKLSIEKQGYGCSQKNRRGATFGFRPDYTPDPANPVIFKMWKMAGKEPLVHSSWHGKAACDGTTNRFDLASGHPSKHGDLEIICSREPINLPPGKINPFTWKFQIKIIGGGIQSTDDEFTYLAPETGYVPILTFGQQAEDPKWNSKKPLPLPKEYYIKTADGHYGRLFVDWYAWQEPAMHLEWDCWINPSGSRNLER